MTVESLISAADTELARAAEIAANPDARPTVFADNPNPTSAPLPPEAPVVAPAEEAEQPERVLTKREQIAERAKARRDASGAGSTEITTTPYGEMVPPFVAQATATAAAEAEAETKRVADEAAAALAATSEPSVEKTYTLKVRGNDVPVASRAELMKLAEVEPDEAKDYTDAALIRLAQKQIAASSILEEAKDASKSARLAARATGNTPPDPAANDLDPPGTGTTDDTTPSDPYAVALEKIQYGDPAEAAKALKDLVRSETDTTLSEREFGERYVRAGRSLEAIAASFEAANPDIGGDAQVMGPLFYERFVIPEVKKALVATGKVSPENAERHVGNTIGTALEAYSTVVADGRFNVATPDVILQAAEAKFRERFPKPSAVTPTPATPAGLHDRAAAKRALAPQPNSGSSIPPVPPAPQESKGRNVVAQMRERRGQSVRR